MRAFVGEAVNMKRVTQQLHMNDVQSTTLRTPEEALVSTISSATYLVYVPDTPGLNDSI